MIEGLKFNVSPDEIRKHCVARSTYHRRRSSEKGRQLPKLREALELVKASPSPDAISHMNKGGYHLNPESAVENLESDIREHDNKALVFDFFADHVFDDDYTLEENDLQRLEILKR